MDQDVHISLIEKLDDEHLEGSGFQFQEIEEVILEIFKVNDNKHLHILSYHQNIRIVSLL